MPSPGRWNAGRTTASRASRARGSRRRRATVRVDRLRRRQSGALKLQEVAMLSSPAPASDDDSGVRDDRLRLIFTCCHPALAVDAQVALDPPYAGRAHDSRDRTGVPGARTRPWRSGWCGRSARSAMPASRTAFRPRICSPSGRTRSWPCCTSCSTRATPPRRGDLLRPDLSARGDPARSDGGGAHARRARGRGLLALMLLQDARRDARVDADGELVLLDDQDRSRWDGEAIDEGRALLDRALRRGRPGPYQVQAAIAACHATASTARRDGLARDRAALRRADADDRLAGRRAQPGRRGRDGRGSRRGTRASPTPSMRRACSTSTSTCTRPVPICCVGSVGSRAARRVPRAPSSSPPPTPSGGSWTAASPRSLPQADGAQLRQDLAGRSDGCVRARRVRHRFRRARIGELRQVGRGGDGDRRAVRAARAARASEILGSRRSSLASASVSFPSTSSCRMVSSMVGVTLRLPRDRRVEQVDRLVEVADSR